MQIRKPDMEQTILDCARDEFLNRGYEDASLRVIAKKANTSLGNIYHYFPNKKAILDQMIRPNLEIVCAFIREHAREDRIALSMKEINDLLEIADFETIEMKALLSKEFVIFMETKEPEYVEVREEVMDVFRNHIARHMHYGDSHNHFVIIVTKMIVDCVIHMVKCNSCVKEKRQDIIDMFKMLCRSVALNSDTGNQAEDNNLTNDK